MAFNFPSSPADGAIYSPGAGLPTYVWNAAMGAWKITSGGLSAGVWIGDAPPVNPVQGQLWWRSTDGMSFIWFVDPTSSQWVEFNTGPAPIVPPVPSGAVNWFAMQTAPTGWLKANGASYLRTDYPNLFAAIGTTYGSADATHFNVPDLRGEFARGWDDGRGVDASRVFGSAQAEDFKAHAHTQQGNITSGNQSADHVHYVGVSGGTGGRSADHAHSLPSSLYFNSSGSIYFTPVGGGYWANNIGGQYTAGENVDHSHAVSIGVNSGGISAAHNHVVTLSGATANAGGTETRPRNVALLACIKV